jgi:hypothetical protein
LPFNTYAPPSLSSAACAKNYVIFIGNGFPSQDLPATVLNNVGGATSQLAMPVLSTSSQTFTPVIGAACGAGGNSGQRAANCTANIPQSMKDANPADTYACLQATESVDATACPGGNNRRFDVQSSKLVISVTPRPARRRCPEQRCAHGRRVGQVPVTTDVSPAPGHQNVRTYTIDVFKDAQDSRESALLFNMARVGGGRYFQATSEEAIINAIRQILVEIQSVNAVFASASLPINATNRSQNENQVFIGMFRPDSNAKPMWYGNLKRYQIGLFGLLGDEAKLADKDGNEAVSNETGFIQPCATSFWTSDSGDYWSFSQDTAGLCTLAATTLFSDAPDGANVEKGATAEVVRKGNNPPVTDVTPTNTVARTLYTCASPSTCKFGQTLDPFDASVVSQAAVGAANATEHQQLIDFLRGVDVADQNGNNNYADVRPSVPGDVGHSRPLTGQLRRQHRRGHLLRRERRRAARGARQRRQGAVGLHRARAPRQARAAAYQSPLVMYPSMTAPFRSDTDAQGLLLRRLGGPVPERRQQPDLDVSLHAARRPHAPRVRHHQPQPAPAEMARRLPEPGERYRLHGRLREHRPDLVDAGGRAGTRLPRRQPARYRRRRLRRVRGRRHLDAGLLEPQGQQRLRHRRR